MEAGEGGRGKGENAYRVPCTVCFGILYLYWHDLYHHGVVGRTYHWNCNCICISNNPR